jgi:4-phosphopantoate--beta-alanine ligase
MENNIPKTHPRYKSLIARDKIADGVKQGIVHMTGLIAHGRGEAFDYLMGEQTITNSLGAEKTAAAILLLADKPVISVNGNVCVLSSDQCVQLSELIPADIEVNLFHRTSDRIEKIINELENYGASNVLGLNADARIPGLDSDRGICDKNGIYSADVVLVPLEDGDRCQALKKMGKFVITIDLNPLSRTAKTADVTIVDEVTRAFDNIIDFVKELKNVDEKILIDMKNKWNNTNYLKDVLIFLSKKLNHKY